MLACTALTSEGESFEISYISIGIDCYMCYDLNFFAKGSIDGPFSYRTWYLVYFSTRPKI